MDLKHVSKWHYERGDDYVSLNYRNKKHHLCYRRWEFTILRDYADRQMAEVMFSILVAILRKDAKRCQEVKETT